MMETWVRCLGQEDPLEKAMAPHSSTLAWKIPWMEEPGGLPSMGSYRVGHNWSDLAAAAAAWRPIRPFRTIPNAKSESQETPGVTGKFGLGVQNEAGQRLTEFCQEKALVIANILFQQDKRWLYTWTSPDVQYWNQIDYILCSQRWRSSKQSVKTRLGVDCGSDHELLIAKFRLNWRK